MEQECRASGSQEIEKVRDDFQEQGHAVERGKERFGDIREESMGCWFEMFLSRC